MQAETMTAAATAGRLSGLQRGVLSGDLSIDDGLLRREWLTVEVFAHGILAATAQLRPQPGQRLLPFTVALERLPLVSLPCTLTARLRETDRALESSVTLTDLADLWARMMPFSARIETISHRQVLIRTSALEGAEVEVFELREMGELLALSELRGLDDEGALFALPLPERLLDGTDHRLAVLHRGSGLPLSAEPFSLRLDLRSGRQADPQDLVRRVEALERSMQQRHAEAFNGLAAPLYRHVDAVAQSQRLNLDREIAALRGLLGLAAAEADCALPEEVLLPFDGPVTGYGLHPAEQSATGKGFRYAASGFGLLLPAIAPGPALLHVQGLRRAHPGALEGVRLCVNGMAVQVTPYLSARSESWNLKASLSGRQLRPDRNMIELRLPNASLANAPPTEGAAGQKGLEKCVGILFVSLSRLGGAAVQECPGG